MLTQIRLLPTRWGVGAAAVILAFTGVLKWNAGLMPEHVAIPNPMPPVPNARDIYNRAESLLRDGDSIDLLPSKSAASSSAASDEAQLVDKKRVAAENEQALAVLRQGLRAQYMEPPFRSADMIFPFFKDDRTMARLLTLEGQLQAGGGDYGGALSDDLDAIQFGTSLQHGAIIIGDLVGIACEETSRKQAWASVERLNAPQAEAAARRLARISAATVPFSSTLQEEEWGSQSVILASYRAMNAHHQSLDTVMGEPGTAEQKLALRLESPRTAYDNYTNYMNEAIRRESLPWPTQRSLKPEPLPADPLNQILLPIFGQASVLQLDNVALNNLLETELALRAYRLQHSGNSPATLAQLVPAYLPSVPSDPFSDGQPLQYRLRGGQTLLYSIGPDAADNGGEPMHLSPLAGSSSSKYPREDSTGDLLAGSG